MQAGHFRDQATGAGKRERTRAALLDATVQLIAEKGMEAVKINDITTAAGMANGTFYNYFNDKDEVLREAAYSVASAVSQQLDREMKAITDAPTRVVRATKNFISIILQKPEWAFILLENKHTLPGLRDDVAQYLQADLELGVAQNKFDVTVTPFLLQQIIALVGAAITIQFEAGSNETQTHEVCENILRLLGFSPTKARKQVAAAIEGDAN